MTIVDHLRAVLATVNDKAYRSGPDQDVIEAARRALAESEQSRHRVVDVDVVNGVLTITGEPRPVWDCDEDLGPVANQRAAFVKAMDEADQRGDE